MTLADRIVVMHDRRIQQVGTPAEVYARPANAFVARFVGSPAMALLPGRIAERSERGLRVHLPCGAVIATAVCADELPLETRVDVGLRPEHVTVAVPGSGGVPARVELVERLGDRSFLYARLAEGSEITAHAAGFSAVGPGDEVMLTIDASRAHLFAADGTAYHPRRPE